jgi:hypothetical protein
MESRKRRTEIEQLLLKPEAFCPMSQLIKEVESRAFQLSKEETESAKSREVYSQILIQSRYDSYIVRSGYKLRGGVKK